MTQPQTKQAYKVDLYFTNSMGFYSIEGATRRGKAWLRDHVQGEVGGMAFSDDSRCVWDLYKGAERDGLRCA